MSSTGCYKDFSVSLVAGGIDTRSPSGKVAFNDFRLILNMDGSEQRGYCRLGGWQPYLKDSELGFKNQDLHDQMIGGQYYHLTYTTTSGGETTITGYQYPQYFPEVVVPPYTIAGEPQGPYCGYALEVPYFFGEVPGDFGITSWFAGYPYNSVLDAGCTDNTGLWIRWIVAIRSDAFSLAETAVEALVTWDSATFGSGSQFVGETDDHIEIHYLSACLPPDATNVQVVNVVGNFQHITKLTAGDYTCDGPAVPPPAGPCLTDDCYVGSYYYLTYTFEYDGYIIPAYYSGYEIPVYSTTPEEVETHEYNDYQYPPSRCREAILNIFPINSVGGRRRLIAATRSRLYVNDDRNGNWRILADGLGGGCAAPDDCSCSSKRWRIASSGNTVLFTNGIDPVLAWEFDAGPDGPFFWSADYVSELRQLHIDTAEVVQCWNGFSFVGNVTQNGDKIASRLFWSDYNNPMSWFPGGNSLANYHDFGNGERILAMEPIGGRLRIYTDKAIYDCVLVRDVEQVFSFQEIYRGQNALRYRYSLVNTGHSHVWMGESSIYVMGEYDRTPQRVEWIHRASGAIYLGINSEWVQDFEGLAAFGPINEDKCDQAVGGWDSQRQAVWFSWPTDDNVCPNMSLVLWPLYSKSSLVDHGFTAFANHRPDFRENIRDFLWTNGFCEALDLLLAKEGVPYSYGGGEYFDYLFNQYENTYYGMDPDSAIGSLCGICLADICRTCDVDVKFLMASATDFTIKEFTPMQCVREMLHTLRTAQFPETAVATYTDLGFYSLLQSDSYAYNTPVEKVIQSSMVEFVADEQTVPLNLEFEIGYGAQPQCFSWQDSDPVPLECLDGGDFDEDANERAGLLPTFSFYARGSWLSWRMFTHGVGGRFCTTAVTLSVRRIDNCW